MKKILLTLLASLLLVTPAYATTLFPTGGGTGSTTLYGILIGNGTAPVNSLSIGSGLTLTGTILAATGGSGSSFPFTPTTNYGAVTNATGTPIWFQAGLQASTTANFLGGLTIDAGGASASALSISGHATNAGSSILISDLNTAGNTLGDLINPSGTSNANLATIPLSATIQTGSGTTGGLIIFNKANAPIIFATGGNAFTNERLNITGTGNVGVGSTSPFGLFSVGSNNVGNFIISTSTSGCAQFSALGELYSTGTNCGTGGGGATFGTTSISATSPLIWNTSTANMSIQVANTSQSGYLTSTDWNTFNNKDSFAYPFPANATTSALTLGGLTLSNVTGTTQCLHVNSSGVVSGTATDCGSSGGSVTSVTATYPILSSGGTAPVISTAFGTTTANTFSSTQTFTVSPVFSTLGAGTVNSTAGGTVYNTATSTPTVTAPITYSGTLGQFIGGVSGTFACTPASAGVTGCLTGTDWSTFNGKQAAGNYITALTGDVTATGPGSVAATLATVNGNVGTFTYPSVTVNGKGLITAISNGTAPTTYTGTFPIQVTGSVISSLFSTTTNSGVAQGNLYVGSGGIFQSSATGTISNGTGISVTAGQSVIGSGLTITNTGVTSLGNGTGTTCSGTAPGTCNVNTTQNITTLSNLTTAGTVNTTASGVLYTTGTSTITAGSGIAYSGTMGSEIGGVSGTLSVSGLTTSNFTSANVSQFTNDAGYLTSATGVTSVKQTYGTAQVGALTFATTSVSFNGLTVADAITNSGGTFTIAPLWSGTLNNAGLTNSSVTVNTGTGLSGGGAVSLGGTALSLTNTGVISNSCSSGISCSGTNPSSFTNTGVTSIVAGTNITVSGATGAVTVNATGGGSSFPFTPTNNFGANTNATSTTLSLFAGLNASSTSRIASTTFDVSGFVGIGTSTNNVNGSKFATVITNSVASLGGLLVQTWTNVTNAFSVNNAAGTTVFNVDTTAAHAFTTVSDVASSTPWASLAVIGDGTDPEFVVSTSTSNNVLPNFEIDANGHLITSGLKPVCTTGCTFGQGNDNDFRITVGTTISTEVVTFSKSWGTFAPICQATEGNDTASPTVIAASSTATTVTLTNTALSAKDIDVSCRGIQ